MRLSSFVVVVFFCSAIMNAGPCPEIKGQWGYGRINSLEVHDGFCYYGMGADLVVADLANPTAPRVVGRLNVNDMTSVSDIAIDGNFLFLAGGSQAGLRIVDISDPSKPKLEEVSDLIINFHGLTAIELYGGIAYVSPVWLDGNYHTLIVDVRNPLNPIVLGTLASGIRAGQLLIHGRRLYHTSVSGLRIFDVADPARPVEIGTCETMGLGLAIDWPHLYSVAHGNFSVWNVSDAANPLQVADWDVPGDAWDIDVKDGYAYVAARNGGLVVYDVSQPTEPVLSSIYDPPGEVSRIVVSRGLGYVGTYFSGLRVVDVTAQPGNVVELGTYHERSHTYDLAVAGNLLYVSDYRVGLKVLDVSSADDPKVISTVPSLGIIRDIEIRDGLAFLTGSDAYNGFTVVDVSVPSAPQKIGTWTNAECSTCEYLAIAVCGSLAYLGTRHGLSIVDVSDPAEPVAVSWVDLIIIPGVYYPLAWDVEVRGDFAYVATGGADPWGEIYGGLAVIDASDPANAEQIGFYDVSGEEKRAYGVALVGDYVYLSLNEAPSSIRIIDVTTDPTNPVLVGEVGQYLGAFRVESFESAMGNLVFVTEKDPGYNQGNLLVYDASNPLEPILLGNYRTSWDAYGVAVDRGRAYIADGLAGVQILDLGGCWPEPLERVLPDIR